MLDRISEPNLEASQDNNLNLLALTTITIEQGGTSVTIKLDDPIKPINPGAGATCSGGGTCSTGSAGSTVRPPMR
jgi:hypothetical protein